MPKKCYLPTQLLNFIVGSDEPNIFMCTYTKLMASPIMQSVKGLITGLENSTRPLVFTSASGCRASENFDVSSEHYFSQYTVKWEILALSNFRGISR